MKIAVPFKSSLLVSAVLVLALPATGSAQSFHSAETAEESLECVSRDCLIQLADDYIEALVNDDTARLPFAEDVYFVENADRKPPGEGFWKTASAPPSSFKIVIPDPVAKQVAVLAMMEEEEEPVLVALRLKVEDGRISEAEHLLARSLRENGLANLQSVREGLLTTIPEGERMERHELLGPAYAYYDALVLDSGELAPMAEECERHENGLITARPRQEQTEGEPNFSAMGCTGQLNTGVMGYIDDIVNRRVPIVDPQTGLAFGLSHFRHAMERKEIPITGVPGVESREVGFNAFDLPAAHVYKIRDGQIYEIEAMGFTAPYNTPTGWE